MIARFVRITTDGAIKVIDLLRFGYGRTPYGSGPYGG